MNTKSSGLLFLLPIGIRMEPQLVLYVVFLPFICGPNGKRRPKENISFQGTNYYILVFLEPALLTAKEDDVYVYGEMLKNPILLSTKHEEDV